MLLERGEGEGVYNMDVHQKTNDNQVDDEFCWHIQFDDLSDKTRAAKTTLINIHHLKTSSPQCTPNMTSLNNIVIIISFRTKIAPKTKILVQKKKKN